MHQSLVEAGKDLGLYHAGMHALDSLRLEAGQLQWGRDISAMDTPYDAGLSHLVCHEVRCVLVTLPNKTLLIFHTYTLN